MSGRFRRVYSTGPDGPGPAESEAPSDGSSAARPRSPAVQRVRVRRERAGRRGKTVTVVGPLCLLREDAQRLLAELKRCCGAGGALRTVQYADGASALELEVQGDQTERILAELAKRGWAPKRAGG